MISKFPFWSVKEQTTDILCKVYLAPPPSPGPPPPPDPPPRSRHHHPPPPPVGLPPVFFSRIRWIDCLICMTPMDVYSRSVVKYRYEKKNNILFLRHAIVSNLFLKIEPKYRTSGPPLLFKVHVEVGLDPCFIS